MLTWEQVQQIRTEHARGVSAPELAKRFDIDRKQAWNIVTGRSWKTPRPFKTWRDKKQRYEIDRDTGCWSWLFYKNEDGYGIVGLADDNGRPMTAHDPSSLSVH